MAAHEGSVHFILAKPDTRHETPHAVLTQLGHTLYQIPQTGYCAKIFFMAHFAHLHPKALMDNRAYYNSQ